MNITNLAMFETGVQIIALNTQKRDINTHLIYSMFLKNKSQLGYRLKPENLRGGQNLKKNK